MTATVAVLTNSNVILAVSTFPFQIDERIHSYHFRYIYTHPPMHVRTYAHTHASTHTKFNPSSFFQSLSSCTRSLSLSFSCYVVLLNHPILFGHIQSLICLPHNNLMTIGPTIKPTCILHIFSVCVSSVGRFTSLR